MKFLQLHHMNISLFSYYNHIQKKYNFLDKTKNVRTYFFK